MNTKISLGNKVREKFTSCVLGEYNLNEGISGVVSEYSKPATKADLTLLAYEIMKLRGTFEGRGGENRKEKGEKE